ncbi:YpbF family protein [Bacillus sp. V3B]|uniref:YpbF family protein n=1 Tax=Bacillus sp. V3B TaxID=2804915 RepID=UPI00210A2863|nr:YpbF family protein [Bacillus sp. V3B]MCQ6273846.1 YpbF family protein [Bacillus sp. V3B]
MESSIIMLDERTDQATKKMLQKVVERKQKYDRLHYWHLVVMWSTIFISFGYFLYLYYTIFLPYSYSFATVFSVYVNNSYHLFMLMFVIGLFGMMNVFRQKRDKAEKEFHALRCEIIDKSKDLWKQEDEWKNRHIVFEMMKKNYDINLYHENK